MTIVIIPAILITLDGVQTWGIKLESLTSQKEIIVKIGKQKLAFLLLAVIAFLPILSAVLWTNFTDAIKQANIFTMWLTSTNLTDWNFGTLDQKISFANWWGWLTQINSSFFLGGILLLFPLLGIMFLYEMPLKSRNFFGVALTGTLFTIFIFFNLFRHEYYYIAVSAYISVLIGFGIFCLCKFLLPHKTWWIVFVGIFFLFIFMKGFEQYTANRADVEAEVDYVITKIIPLANRVAAITPENKYIISFQSNWYPDFILYTKRKGLVISPNEDSKFSCELINKYQYSTIVVVDRPPDTPELLGIFNCFKSIKLIKSGIYKINP